MSVLDKVYDISAYAVAASMMIIGGIAAVLLAGSLVNLVVQVVKSIATRPRQGRIA